MVASYGNDGQPNFVAGRLDFVLKETTPCRKFVSNVYAHRLNISAVRYFISFSGFTGFRFTAWRCM